MIKRLQLRGISRKPSDRYTEDGGCAESLNVFIDNDETAPALKPAVVNTTMKDEKGRAMFPYESWQTPWEAVFIHKTPTYTRAIIKYVEGSSTKLGVWTGNGCEPFMTLEDNFIRCINLGNTLGVVTEGGTYWVIWKDEGYHKLGTSIPFPAFTFANYDVSSSEATRSIRLYQTYRLGDETYKFSIAGGLEKDILTDLWGEIDKALATNGKSGVFNRQQFAVFALRLFDGTRLISTPTLLAPGFDSPFDVSCVQDIFYWSSGTSTRVDCTVNFNMAYKVFFRLDESSTFFDQWSDIVDSFEIYLSPQITPNRDDAMFSDPDIHYSSDKIDRVEGKLVLGETGDSVLKKYLDSSNFYRVYSAPVDSKNINLLRAGIMLDTKNYMSTDNLVTAGIRLDTLSDMKHYEVKFTRATLYNNKVIASGITEKVKMDIHNPIATYYYNPTLASETHPTYTYRFLHNEVLAYRLTFYLRDSYGKSFSIKATNKGEEYFFFQSESINGTNLWSNGYGMIMCPDARAFAVDVQAVWGTPASIRSGSANVIGSATLSMTEHPNLDCSYWYGDITKELFTFCPQFGTYSAGSESYEDDRPNKIYMSEMDNPFVFPVASRYTMNSKVLGHAIATAALSEGQFGQFPIYVFTVDGIWAMESASDGTIVSTKPMSREVCSNPDSITSIDNAVVFVTEKTVMLISGSQVSDISPFMNGQHFNLNTSSREWTMIASGAWSAFLNTLADDTHFMSFMENAMIAYDYKGNRLVFINEGETFQYVYMLRTNTWHKMYVDGYQLPMSYSYTLNSYPDSFVNLKANGRHYILNLSNKLDVTSSESLKGVIITRPFDLDAPDVRKGIRDIRIRGYHNRSDARYILLGSMDGIHWGVLPSLHGGSYKWFRLIILTDLTPTERISWVDIDYDTRFQNRLR